MRYIATLEGRQITIEVLDERHISVDGTVLEVNFETISGQPVFSLLVNGRSHEAYVYPGEDNWQVLMRGRLYQVDVEDEREARLHAMLGSAVAETGEFHLRAPMPGLVIGIPVSEGQAVEKGQVLVILESMKMQNELKAPRAGTVHRIRIRPGESVEQKQNLLSLA